MKGNNTKKAVSGHNGKIARLPLRVIPADGTAIPLQTAKIA
jgi:hypothetical protein